MSASAKPYPRERKRRKHMVMSQGYIVKIGDKVVYHPMYDYVRYLYSDEEIMEVCVVEDKDGKYWAWWSWEEEIFKYVHPLKSGVTINLPYGHESYERRGIGELMKVSLVERSKHGRKISKD